MIRLKTPVVGLIIEVQDDNAALYIEKGFTVVEEAPKKKQPRKRTTKTKEQ